MNTQKDKLTNKIKLLDELIGLMRTLQDTLSENQTQRGLGELKATFRDDLVNVTVDKNVALPSSYQLEVVQLAQKSSVLSAGFEDPNDIYFGVGYFSYELPDGTEKEVYIDSDNSSLNGIATVINRGRDNNMTATVINDGSENENPWKLLISLKETGDKNKATFPEFYLLDGEEDFLLEQERKAQDAKIKLDGFEIEVAENSISDLIPGLNIELKRASQGEEFTIVVMEDSKKITEKISNIVTNINNILKFINEQNSIDGKTDTSQMLSSDITLTTFENKIRSIIFKTHSTKEGSKRLGDLGITFQKNGLLQFNKEKFESLTSSDFTIVNSVLNGMVNKDGYQEGGFIRDIYQTVNLALRTPDGSITNRKRGIQSRIDQVDRQIDQRQRFVDQREKNLKDKFAKLEGTISRIKSQGAGLSSLTKQMANPKG